VKKSRVLGALALGAIAFAVVALQSLPSAGADGNVLGGWFVGDHPPCCDAQYYAHCWDNEYADEAPCFTVGDPPDPNHPDPRDGYINFYCQEGETYLCVGTDPTGPGYPNTTQPCYGGRFPHCYATDVFCMGGDLVEGKSANNCPFH